MRRCLVLPIGGPAAAPGVMAELAALGESAGWDAVFVEDYIGRGAGGAGRALDR